MKQRKPANSFSLIEILVVVTVVSILVAILMPSLQSAKERARRIQCLSNIRQIGLSIEYYKEDNEGFYPIRRPTAYTFSDKNVLMNLLGSNYLRSNFAVFSCPANFNRIEQMDLRTNASGGRMDYELNSGIFSMHTDGTNNFNQKVVVAAIAPVLFDFPPPNYLLGYLGGGHVLASDMPHRSQGCNVYFADSHVAWLEMEASKQSIEGRFPYFEWGRF